MGWEVGGADQALLDRLTGRHKDTLHRTGRIFILTNWEHMRLTVANNDVTAGLGQEVSISAKAMVADKARDEVSAEDSVLSLRLAKNEADYLDRLMALMRSRAGTGNYDFHVPRKPGLVGNLGALLKRVLWKLLRYQHDRVAFQQNSVNTHLTAALELMRSEYEHKIEVLERKIAELEKRGN